MMSILADRFRATVSKSKDYRMKSESEFDVGHPTGFLSFDFLNGTIVHVRSEQKNYDYYSIGIVDGSMVMIIGRAGCGKSTWAVQSAANLVRPYKTSCIWEDNIEGGMTVARREELTKFHGDELRHRYISRSSGITAENFYERIKTIYDLKMENRSDFEYDTGVDDTCGNRIYKLEPSVYILDSLALLTPEKYSDEDELSGQMSSTAAAKSNSMVFKRIVPMLKTANIILYVINHINQKIEINMFKATKSQVSYLKQGESLPGGNAAIYLSNNLIRFDDHSKLKSTEGFCIDGSLVDLTLVKSRTNKAGKSITLVFNQDHGYDEDLSLFMMLKNSGRINGAGAYLYLRDRDDIKFSQKAFKDKLASNPELRKIFMEEVVDALKATLVDDYKEPITEEILDTESVTEGVLKLLIA